MSTDNLGSRSSRLKIHWVLSLGLVILVLSFVTTPTTRAGEQDCLSPDPFEGLKKFGKEWTAQANELQQVYWEIERQTRATIKVALALRGASERAIKNLPKIAPLKVLLYGGINNCHHEGWSGWQLNWETGKRFPRDPVAWVASLPECSLNLSCKNATFRPDDQTNQPADRSKCRRRGVFTINRHGDVMFCGKVGEYADGPARSPEQKSAEDAHMKELQRKEAQALRRAKKKCEAIRRKVTLLVPQADSIGKCS